MKNIILILFTLFLFTDCHSKHSEGHHSHAKRQDEIKDIKTDSAFKAKRIARSATIICESSAANVFPLFGPVAEKKWADGWDFNTIYSETNLIEENFIFQTNPHKGDTLKTTWIISRYDSTNMVIEYILFSENWIDVINIKCRDNGNRTTNAKISYTYTALNEKGNSIIEHLAAHMYAHGLKDWEEAINYYLKNNKMLQHK